MSASPSASAIARGLFSNPYLLLVLTVAMWGGHSVVSRLAVGEISPASLTCLRWLVVASIMFAVAGRGLREHWPVLRPRIGYLAAMGTLGYTGYNILLYWSAHYTTAINLNIINGAMPALIFLFALAIFRQKITPLQWIGTSVSMAGVAVVAAKGDWAALATLTVTAAISSSSWPPRSMPATRCCCATGRWCRAWCCSRRWRRPLCCRPSWC